MKHLLVCDHCGKSWTEGEATTLPQSDSTAPRPLCCGFPITHETWEDEELSAAVSKAVADATGFADSRSFVWRVNGDKEKELERLALLLEQNDVDPLWIPWLPKFNALDGVVTKACCQGHPHKIDERDENAGNPYLWLEVAPDVAAAFFIAIMDELMWIPGFHIHAHRSWALEWAGPDEAIEPDPVPVCGVGLTVGMPGPFDPVVIDKLLQALSGKKKGGKHG